MTARVSEVLQPHQSFFRAVCQIMLFSAAAAFVIASSFFFSFGNVVQRGGSEESALTKQAGNGGDIICVSREYSYQILMLINSV